MRRYKAIPEPASHVYFCVKDTITGKITDYGLRRDQAQNIANQYNKREKVHARTRHDHYPS